MANAKAILAPGSKVAIVGGGTAGLYVCNVCLEHNLVPTVFEAAHDVGGVWRSSGPGGVAYDTLTTNSSHVITCPPDYPWPFQPKTWHPTASEFVKMLNMYVDDKSLRSYVRFNRRVERVTRVPGAAPPATKWAVATRNPAAAGAEDEQPLQDEGIFDAVLTCTGQYGYPVLPPIPGSESFLKAGGALLHSSEYRSASLGAGRDVMILGMGNSSLDITMDMANGPAKSVFHAARNGAYLAATDSLNGRPGDYKSNNRYATYGPKPRVLPASMRGSGGGDTRYNKEEAVPLEQAKTPAVRVDQNSMILAAFVEAGMPPPPLNPMKANFSICKNWAQHVGYMRSGRIGMGPGVERLEGRVAVLSNGKRVPVDVLICATGYELRYPFLDSEVLAEVERDLGGAADRHKRWLRLYRLAMHPTHQTLCFCGTVGAPSNEAGCGEMQSRYCLALLTGRIPMPSAAEIEENLRKREEMLERTKPYGARGASYIKYMDELAEQIGARPNVPALPEAWAKAPPRDADESGDPVLFNLWYGPTTLQHWRLNGQDAWKGAEQFFKDVHKMEPIDKDPKGADIEAMEREMKAGSRDALPTELLQAANRAKI